MGRKKSSTTSAENKTLRLDKNDGLIQLKVKDMTPGVMMFTDPLTMIVKRNGDCWLNPDGFVSPNPDTIQDRVIGLLRDTDGKFIVFARNMNLYWEKISFPTPDFLPIKEIRGIATEVIEKIEEEQKALFSLGDDEDEESW